MQQVGCRHKLGRASRQYDAINLQPIVTWAKYSLNLETGIPTCKDISGISKPFFK
jgi:hypothetical protein